MSTTRKEPDAEIKRLKALLGNERRRRMQAEEEVRQSEAYLHLLLESAPVAIAIYSDNKFVFSNRAHRKIMGAEDPSELMGRNVLDVIAESCHQLFLGRQRVVLEEGADVPLTSYKCRRLDGALIDVETIAIPFLFRGKKAIMGIARDVTQQTRAEEEVKLQREQLIRADKLASLGTVASGVAHEISNPNNFIMMNASLLGRFWNDLLPVLDTIHRDRGEFMVGRMKYAQMREKVPGLCSGILEGSRRITHIVKELKDFSRPEEPAIHAPVDINQVVKAAVSLLSNLIQKSTRNFSLEAAEGLPRVRGSFQRLEQVMVNLIVNACQALTDKSGAVGVTTGFDWETQRVWVKVHDQGTGIPSEYLSRITDPFFTTKRDSGGTGLGLSVSSRIIADHGALLTYRSEPGAGTEACISFPVPQGSAASGVCPIPKGPYRP